MLWYRTDQVKIHIDCHGLFIVVFIESIDSHRMDDEDRIDFEDKLKFSSHCPMIKSKFILKSLYTKSIFVFSNSYVPTQLSRHGKN